MASQDSPGDVNSGTNLIYNTEGRSYGSSQTHQLIVEYQTSDTDLSFILKVFHTF